MHHWIVDATQSNYCSKKVSISLLMCYGPQQSSAEPTDYKISRCIVQYEQKLQVNKTKKKQAAINRSLEKQ